MMNTSQSCEFEETERQTTILGKSVCYFLTSLINELGCNTTLIYILITKRLFDKSMDVTLYVSVWNTGSSGTLVDTYHLHIFGDDEGRLVTL